MRKTCLLALLFAVPALGAVETTRIQGKVIAPDGSAVTGGKIVCELSAPASAMDPALGQMVRIGSRYASAISATGEVDFSLVPNDVTTPETVYSCRFSISGPAAASWTETWSVASSPDPIAIGAIERVEEVPSIEHFVRRISQASRLSSTCAGAQVFVEEETGNIYRCVLGEYVLVPFLDFEGAENDLVIRNSSGGLKTVTGYSYSPALSALIAPNLFAGTLIQGKTLRALEHLRLPVASAEDADCTPEGEVFYKEGNPPEETEGYICSGGKLRRMLRSNGTSLDLDGNGTANSADWNHDGNLDEAGSNLTGAVKINRLLLPAGTGATGITHGGNILQLIDMMSGKCIDPWTCSRAAVVDTWQALFQGQPMRFNADAGGSYYEIAQGNINKCYGADCTGNENYMCIDSVADIDGDGSRDIDPDADGTEEFGLGDTFTVGNDYAPTLRSHLIYSMADGDGTTCPATTTRIAIGPYVAETAEGVAANVKIMNIWRNRLHANFNAGYLLGYRLLGYGSAMTGWQMGPNLLPNGDLDYDATLGRWTVSGTAPDGRAWYNDPITAGFSSFMCSQGSTTNVCMDMGGTTAADYWETTDWIAVTPGERLVGSCFIRDPGTAPNATIFGVYSDANEDGTLSAETGMTWTVPAANAFEFTSTLQQWYASWTIPEGVSRIKFRITKTTTNAARPLLDDCWLRRPSTSLVESYDTSTKTEYLIPDPGDRPILITGDSWAGGFTDACVFPCNTTLGYYIRDGLADALQERLGRDVSGQIYLTGIAGINSSQVLSATTCLEDADADGTNRDWGYTGGSESCFYMQIERYAPAIVIVSLGTNDAQQSVAAATFVNQMAQLAAKIRAIGAFPIFLAPYPVSKDENSDNLITSADFGAGKTYEFAHSYRDALKRAWKMGQL